MALTELEFASCRIDGCTDPQGRGTRGWCAKHYNRWLRYGDPFTVFTGVGRPKSAAEGYAQQIDRSGPVVVGMPKLGNCHLWMGEIDEEGYAVVGYNRGWYRVNRVIWIAGFGPVPPLLRPDNFCRNSLCVRLTHLALVPAV